jgi:hypothetical protein
VLAVNELFDIVAPSRARVALEGVPLPAPAKYLAEKSAVFPLKLSKTIESSAVPLREVNAKRSVGEILRYRGELY